MHHVGDVQQGAAAERAGGVRTREVLAGETARFQQCDRERIAERERGGGARRGREVERAGFGRYADIEVDVGPARQGRAGATGHRDQRVALALQHRQQHEQFVGFAGIGQRQHHVCVGDHAEIAMPGFARVDVERRGAGRGQRRRDLARDVPGLAHPGAGHAPAGGEDQRAGAAEIAVQARGDRLQAADFDLEHAAAAGGARQCLCVERWCGVRGHIRWAGFPLT